MSKYFLYIDESKHYKDNILYIWGIVTSLGFHAFEKFCQNQLPEDFPYELKSTRPKDRQILEKILQNEDCPFWVFTRKLIVKNDTEYVRWLLQFLEDFINSSDKVISSLDISADFIRLDSDMRRFQKSLSRKLSNHFKVPIVIEFKNSSQYRCIQFADLVVGIHRRE